MRDDAARGCLVGLLIIAAVLLVVLAVAVVTA